MTRSKVLPLDARQRRAPKATSTPRSELARLVDVDERGVLVAQLTDGRRQEVRLLAHHGRAALVEAVRRQGEVLLSWVEGSERPIVVGLLADDLDGVDAAAIPERDVLELKAGRQIELTCGKARLSMQSDGLVRIEGASVDVSSTGPVGIDGAHVRVN